MHIECALRNCFQQTPKLQPKKQPAAHQGLALEPDVVLSDVLAMGPAIYIYLIHFNIF